MNILRHKLIATDPSEQVSYHPDLDTSGPLIRPQIAVIHYAVTTSAAATEQVLKAREYVSAHVTLDSKQVIQMVPFDRIAFHAGVSSYRGKPKVNTFSLGIEVSNPGPLVKRQDGSFATTYGAKWDGPVFEGWHKHDEAHKGYRYWAEYSEAEVDMCCQIVDLWRHHYGITDVVGHDDVSPGRKSDPGPAFPIDYVRKAIFSHA